jgi:dTDP-4-dehydrorhamnose 3,5-epimerase
VRVTASGLPEVLLVEPAVHADARGHFLEAWSQARHAAAGLPAAYVQDNVSFSHGGVLRGLHLQHPRGQGKLVWAAHGEVFDVAVDVRLGSPTFGRWVGYTLSAANARQLYVPPGFAHGFLVTGASAVVAYKVTAYHDAGGEVAIAWDDPELAIPWPIGDARPTLSRRDEAAPRLCDVARDRLPAFVPAVPPRDAPAEARPAR